MLHFVYKQTDVVTRCTHTHTHHIVVDERPSYDLLKCNKNGVTWNKSCFIVGNCLGPLAVLTAKLLDQRLNALWVG